jgi:hypothetical protein
MKYLLFTLIIYASIFVNITNKCVMEMNFIKSVDYTDGGGIKEFVEEDICQFYMDADEEKNPLEFFFNLVTDKQLYLHNLTAKDKVTRIEEEGNNQHIISLNVIDDVTLVTNSCGPPSVKLTIYVDKDKIGHKRNVGVHEEIIATQHDRSVKINFSKLDGYFKAETLYEWLENFYHVKYNGFWDDGINTQFCKEIFKLKNPDLNAKCTDVHPHEPIPNIKVIDINETLTEVQKHFSKPKRKSMFVRKPDQTQTDAAEEATGKTWKDRIRNSFHLLDSKRVSSLGNLKGEVLSDGHEVNLRLDNEVKEKTHQGRISRFKINKVNDIS